MAKMRPKAAPVHGIWGAIRDYRFAARGCGVHAEPIETLITKAVSRGDDDGLSLLRLAMTELEPQEKLKAEAGVEPAPTQG